jgi:hypothetical protein
MTFNQIIEQVPCPFAIFSIPIDKKTCWRSGDELTLTLPMALRAEPAPDDAHTLAFLSGPLVLAADCGPASAELSAPAPALREGDALSGLVREAAHIYRIPNARPDALPNALTLKPFYAMYDRRTAPYLRQMSDAQWAAHAAVFEAETLARAALDARTLDWIKLGEEASEAAHAYRANHADLLQYERVPGRQAWWGQGNYLEFELAARPGAMALHALYWGEEVNKDFEISIDGEVLARERRAHEPVREFVAREYPIPRALTRGKSRVTVRFETRGTDAPVYGVRMLAPD